MSAKRDLRQTTIRAEGEAKQSCIHRKKTPFVLLERTGGAFSSTIAFLRYRYLAVPAVEPFRRHPYSSKKVLR
jgi:hypothetical protein